MIWWVLIGGAIGFFVGGTVGTLVAPQGGTEALARLPERLNAGRVAAQKAAEQAEQATVKRLRGSRGRRRRRGRRR